MKKRNYFIWVDDNRALPQCINWMADEFIVCKTYKQAIKALNTYCTLGNVYLDLDHDLGCKRTGYDIAKYVVEHQLPFLVRQKLKNLLYQMENQDGIE